MSFSMSTYLRNLIRDYLHRNDPGGFRPLEGHLAAYTTIPAADDSGGVEPTLTGYARQQLDPSNTNWAAPGTGATENTPEVSFGVLSDGPQRIIGLGYLDAAAGGNLLWSGPLATGWVGFVAESTTDLFTVKNHGYANDDPVFIRGENLPGGVAYGAEYFVRDVAGDDFRLAASAGGAAIVLSSDGFGQIGASKAKTIDGDEFKFLAGAIDWNIQ